MCFAAPLGFASPFANRRGPCRMSAASLVALGQRQSTGGDRFARGYNDGNISTSTLERRMSAPLLIAKSKLDLCLLPQMANRHGLITGATGTGKTVTLQNMAE